MEPPNTVSASATSHPVEGGTEVDVTVTVPAGALHPSATVVPADNPGADPVLAGDLAPTVPVHTVGPAPDGEHGYGWLPDTPPAPTASGHPGDTATTTAGEAGNGVVIRPDDPNATPVPAGDLDPSTVVIPADTPPVEPATVTAADVSPLFADTSDPEAVGAEMLRRLDALGFRVVRK